MAWKTHLYIEDFQITVPRQAKEQQMTAHKAVTWDDRLDKFMIMQHEMWIIHDLLGLEADWHY